MIKCNNCGSNNDKEAKFCIDCGKRLTNKSNEKKINNLISCKDCGKKISKNAELCPSCGVRLKKKIDQSITRGITDPKDPSVAAALGVFFGPLGYLNLRRYGLFFFWLVCGIILISITWIAAPILWIAWGVHMHQIATQINDELGVKND